MHEQPGTLAPPEKPLGSALYQEYKQRVQKVMGGENAEAYYNEAAELRTTLEQSIGNPEEYQLFHAMGGSSLQKTTTEVDTENNDIQNALDELLSHYEHS